MFAFQFYFMLAYWVDFFVVASFSHLKLPLVIGSTGDDEYEDLGPSVSRMSHPFTSEGFRITKAAIAGLVGEAAKNFEPGKKTN